MNSRSAPPGFLPAVVVIGVLLLQSMPRLDDRALVKIERQQASGASAAEWLAEIDGVQELQTGWIAEASSAVVSRLQAAGIALTVLDPAPAGKHHFLVFPRSVGASAAAAGGATGFEVLATLGLVARVEDHIALVAAEDEALRARLPAAFSLARLTLSSPVLVPLRFDTPGRARAVPRAQQAVAAADARIAQAVAQVSRERLSSTIRTLESYGSRYASTTNLTSAANYLFDQFQRLGLRTEFDDFTFSTPPLDASNVVATIPGRSSASDVVIVGAHYDSFSDQRPAVAPGADDNASGTAAILEAARVLAGTPFDFTVKVIAFSAEEWGLFGSKHYAQAARARGERIVGVVNLDMIGYVDQVPEDLDVIANPGSEWLVDRFAAAAGTYAPLPVLKTISASMRSSDHAPFWDQGYSAVLCIEDSPLRNPYYHRVTDRLETLNMPFAESVARAAVAVVADLAQPVSAVATPAGLVVTAETARSLFARATRHRLEWTASSGAAGYNIYRATTSHGTYRRLNGSPVSSTLYADVFVPANVPSYYVVTAVDGQGRESNFSAEARGQ